MTETKRAVGRPSKRTIDKSIKRNVSFSRANNDYIIGIIEERNMQIDGNFSRILNEIVSDHVKVKRFKDMEKAKHQEKLEMLK